ncbi:MAG: hypothetical protein ABIO65_07465 [Nitrospiria bacterium]
MDDALFVGGFERIGDLPRDGEHVGEGYRTAGDLRRQVSPSTSSMIRARVSPPGP